jgi:transcriptional regulator with GAF, ATPase, and Fis domain
MPRTSTKESFPFQLDAEWRSRHHGDSMAVPLLADQDRRGHQFDEIVGKSPALWTVLEQVERVAPTDSTLLILGETGTGKELIAHAVHNVSSRRGRPFIKLNCAAIPFDLLESELFGHEKGAFTGAIAQKIGRFEMADTGTLLLDEVGDIPLSLQPKLLRVLQEQEFERLGSGRTHKVDVRLVAATNRNLLEMITRNEFRSDLYYRLNVFPITLPPLRTRQEDIPELVTHFVEIFSQRMRKEVNYIEPQTMEAFTSYSWPGNIRELQNLIERAVILANDRVLPNPLPASKTIAPCVVASIVKHSESTIPKTFRDSARDLILQALDASEWVVGGSKGAATKLGLKRTTLIDKMKKLGIQRPAGLAGSPDANRFHEGWQPVRQTRCPKSYEQGETPQVHSLSGQ